ncbi:MAG TPA: hypothetical protein VFT34_08390, partial [Verrucomicrobiae bacterium]|nr:hypothetical protein [Verrucomicrobiae bacterium]
SGGEFHSDNPLTVVETPEGDIDVVDTPGLPGVVAFAAGEVVFDTLNPKMDNQLLFTRYTARLMQGLEQRTVDFPLATLPAILQPANGRTRVRNGKYFFVELPSSLQKRVFYDPILGKLGIQGLLNDKSIGEPTLTAAPGAVYVLEPNIMTPREGQLLDGSTSDSPLKDLAGTTFATKARELFNLARNPNGLDQGNNGVDTAYRVGLEQEIIRNANGTALLQTNTTGIVSVRRDKTKAASLQALGPGLALVTNPNFLDPNDPTPDISYVTIAENNHPSLGGAPVTLFVIKVDKRQRYRGAIKTILSDNVFDENIVLRHTGDFGANADDLVFEWWYRPEDGTSALTPDLQPAPNPWKLFGDPSGNQGVGFYQLTLKGNPSAPEALLADSLFFLRYRHKNDAHDGVNWAVPQANGASSIPFQWAGAGNSTPNDVDGDGFPDYQPQLAEGWVKRVLRAVNPYEARIRDFTGDNPATYSSILRQLGQRFEGPVALNPAQNVIENVGLIELYETIFQRAKNLSIDLSTPISTPGIANALQLASTRLGDFYQLLGNEAYADAENPTIAFDSSNAELYGYLEPAVFAFQNQVSSLLEEELALLRGLDAFYARPVYNRLFWNFTSGEGEAAYAHNYNVTDVTLDGFIDERDAQIFYPQGHGDAWGHYLTALRYQYELLTHPYFNWVSRSEYVNIQDIVVAVDYLDERKFAQIAAAKAKAGAEIVNMTYREKYVANPDGQWQGYLDTDKNRAWGFEEWARRAGQGAFFDWVTANALLPATHPNTNLTGIAKVDRTTVNDIALISANLAMVQSKVEEASSGNNPIGVANGAITFDIDPTFLEVGSTAQIGTRAVQGLFHFDQIFERALQALKNATAIFKNASDINNSIREVANSEEAFRIDVFQEDLAYRNQLIEIFGSPYEGTIGSGRAYPAGYQGPDTMLFAYVDVRQINDSTVPRQTAVYSSNYLQTLTSSGLLRIDNPLRQSYAESFQGSTPTNYQIVNYTDYSNASGNPPRLADSAFAASLHLPLSTAGYTFQAPSEWGRRASPGELQALLSQLLQAEGDVASAMAEWDALTTGIIRQLRLLNAQYDLNADVRARLQSHLDTATGLASRQIGFQAGAAIAELIANTISDVGHDLADGSDINLPIFGLAVSPGNGPSKAIKIPINLAADLLSLIPRILQLTFTQLATRAELDRELEAIIKDLDVDALDRNFALKQSLVELENLVGDEGIKRVEIFKAIEHMREMSDQYRAKLAEGFRLMQEREYFNKRTAAMTQANRYQDVSFRIARNAALEKYRSAFDLAARYTYIAAATYDYETNLRPDDPGAPGNIFQDIIKARTLGISNEDGQPAIGGGGLSESLAILKANYDLLKTRMGFNQPQIEFATFSMRYELFRIPLEEDDTNGTPNALQWRTELSKPEHYKDDLWQVPEFRQYCRPFAAATNGPQPGLVIPFSSYVISGSNFFGWPLGGGDNAY